MKYGVLTGFLTAALVWACSLNAADFFNRGIRWQTDLNAAHSLSVQTQKPMLFVFGAEWCTWCKKLESTTLSDAQMARYINDNFVPIHIDADKDPRVVQILQADSFPTSVILSPNADLLGRISGYKDVSGYHAALAEAVGHYRPAVAPAPARTPANAPNQISAGQRMIVQADGPPVPRQVVQANATQEMQVRPAPYHKTYPSYPQPDGVYR